MSTETRRLVRTDSPGRPPRLAHSSWTMWHTSDFILYTWLIQRCFFLPILGNGVNVVLLPCVSMLTNLCAELFLSRDDTEKVHDFEEECMEDFFREKENKFQSSSEERIRVINDRWVPGFAIRVWCKGDFFPAYLSFCFMQFCQPYCLANCGEHYFVMCLEACTHPNVNVWRRVFKGVYTS